MDEHLEGLHDKKKTQEYGCHYNYANLSYEDWQLCYLVKTIPETNSYMLNGWPLPDKSGKNIANKAYVALKYHSPV